MGRLKLKVDDGILIINETPDMIKIKPRWLASKKGKEPGVFDAQKALRGIDNLHFSSRASFAFGYEPSGRQMRVTKEYGYHYDLGFKREKLQYAGRFWFDKEVISFWHYPKNINHLKRVLYDIERAFNMDVLDNEGARILPDEKGKFWTVDHVGHRVEAKTRAQEYGKHLQFYGGWLLDVPTEDVSYNKGVGGHNIQDIKITNGGESYLYSLAAVFSGMKLQGPWGHGDSDISVDTGKEHLVAPIFKAEAVKKLDGKALQKMYQYFKDKDNITSEDERLYGAMARRIHQTTKKDDPIWEKFPFDPFHFEHWYETTFGDRQHLRVFGKKGEYEDWQRHRKLPEGLEIYVGNGLIYIKENEKNAFTIFTDRAILGEAPHIEMGDQSIDLEFEADRVAGMKKIILAVMREEITDKYGSRFRLRSDSEVNEFIKKIMRNPQVRRLVS